MHNSKQILRQVLCVYAVVRKEVCFFGRGQKENYLTCKEKNVTWLHFFLASTYDSHDSYSSTA